MEGVESNLQKFYISLIVYSFPIVCKKSSFFIYVSHIVSFFTSIFPFFLKKCIKSVSAATTIFTQKSSE